MTLTFTWGHKETQYFPRNAHMKQYQRKTNLLLFFFFSYFSHPIRSNIDVVMKQFDLKNFEMFCFDKFCQHCVSESIHNHSPTPDAHAYTLNLDCVSTVTLINGFLSILV